MKRLASLILLSITLLVNISCAKPEDKYVMVTTQFGNIKIKLYKETPAHQENFIKLTKQDFYDGLLFHRVISGFMIQGGDPTSKNAAAGARLGAGDIGYTIPAEILPQFFHKRGVLAAARQGNQQNPERRSSGSQFFIVQGRIFSSEEIQEIQSRKNQSKTEEIFRKYFNQEKDELMKLREQQKEDEFNVRMAKLQEKAEAEAKTIPDYVFSKEQIDAYTTIGGYPSLDGEYTIFGEVVEGMDVVDKIASVSTDQANRPLEDIKFKITVCDK